MSPRDGLPSKKIHNSLFCLKIDIHLYANIRHMFNDLPSKIIKWLIVILLGLYVLGLIGSSIMTAIGYICTLF